jgi:membrane protein
MTTDTSQRASASGVPGEDAEKPSEVPARGWLQIVRRAWKEAKADQVPLLGAGVAFYAFMSIFPAMIALVLLYGLVADPAKIASQVKSFTGALPSDVQTLITNQLTTMASSKSHTLGISLVVAVLLALWSASSGVGNLMTAVNTAYDEEETRGFVKRKAIALLMTVGAIVFMIVVIGLVAVVPPLLTSHIDSSVLRMVLSVVRFVVLAGAVAAALAVVYRLSPSRDAPKMRWVSTGAIVATILWLVASIGFSLYVSHFGSYAKTYGALASVVVLLMWLWITSYAILLGAEINAEAEQQTAADTTKGPAQPIGTRGAVKADSTPGND